eukprot:GHRR01021863.1.p1 GENE.GHRR01021863.1~~GHRR01021863.1.p1  ORF type:complete len:197 (+),score=64.14 GHRR01021863.1:397-987(+)
MDSRLVLSKIMPALDIGDIEMIRNAGGRVTPDVLRSLFVAQEVPELSTRAVMIIHHTDCGAQAVMRHHDYMVNRMKELLGQWNILAWVAQVVISTWSSIFLPSFIRKKLLNAVFRPFSDPIDSVKEDVGLLRHAPLMPSNIPIYGMVYDVLTGKLHHIITSSGEGKSLVKNSQDYVPGSAAYGAAPATPATYKTAA